jgi:hypothetical protein
VRHGTRCTSCVPLHSPPPPPPSPQVHDEFNFPPEAPVHVSDILRNSLPCPPLPMRPADVDRPATLDTVLKRVDTTALGPDDGAYTHPSWFVWGERFGMHWSHTVREHQNRFFLVRTIVCIRHVVV